jgi:hypothetical protein
MALNEGDRPVGTSCSFIVLHRAVKFLTIPKEYDLLGFAIPF